MEGLTRLVSESLARHGLDRPVDYRRLHWSQWFRCESAHSLLFVPSKPGVFALAEEIVAPGDLAPKRMLAVLQFCEDDDMAFVLDRMLSRQNPMRARLASGRCFVRYVVIEDAAQRRSITGALNQWLIYSGESASGIGAHFATSLELSATNASVARTCPERESKGPSPATDGSTSKAVQAAPAEPRTDQGYAPPPTPASHLDSGASTNIHCPSPLPSGF
jgi:hypothetical protein